MKIHSYVLSMEDDCDTLGDALNSLAYFSDRIFVTDGLMGPGTLCHHQRLFVPIGEWLLTRPEYSIDLHTWSGVAITLFENSFRDPAHQRNITLDLMSKEPDQPDFIVWIDSDEVCSWEFINGIRPYLETVPSSVTNICPRWLTLIQDERHYFPDHSNWLAHARIHRPGTLSWRGNWHEDGQWIGDKIQWGTSILHTRMVFRRRLYIQRGHPFVRDGWKNAECVLLPDGIATWPKLTWPADEPVIPFDIDIREFEGGVHAKIG